MWHLDHYLGRAIVTYNLAGTEFVSKKGVCLDLLSSWKASDPNVPGFPWQTDAAKPGDIFFMKGRGFPEANGLIHRSPDTHFEDNKMSRLVLKVDLPYDPPADPQKQQSPGGLSCLWRCLSSRF